MKKQQYIAISIIIALVLGIGGYLLGQQAGIKKSSEEIKNLKSLVDLAFPPPPQEMLSLTGTVKGVYGATIQLEIDDPNDYLPRLDNSPRKKQTRNAITSNETSFTLIDYTKIDQEGNPTISQIKLSDIKTGDIITVRSNQNIRNAEKFDVTAVEVVKNL